MTLMNVNEAKNCFILNALFPFVEHIHIIESNWITIPSLLTSFLKLISSFILFDFYLSVDSFSSFFVFFQSFFFANSIAYSPFILPALYFLPFFLFTLFFALFFPTFSSFFLVSFPPSLAFLQFI